MFRSKPFVLLGALLIVFIFIFLSKKESVIIYFSKQYDHTYNPERRESGMIPIPDSWVYVAEFTDDDLNISWLPPTGKPQVGEYVHTSKNVLVKSGIWFWTPRLVNEMDIWILTDSIGNKSEINLIFTPAELETDPWLLSFMISEREGKKQLDKNAVNEVIKKYNLIKTSP
ncbi:MAG: hypothetical protein KKA07_11620 [Bacteroidetes bacterium]|nr:hypothetical protein [Bacteroidota bacterium]MBU1719708.1 hypothetical protein [Bacteroidota bacterium]